MIRDCVFCRIIRGETPAYKVYEDEKVLAFLDIHPSAPGHTLIIPKTHEAQIERLSEEDARQLFTVLHKLAGKIQSAVSASSSTIGINNGPDSGQEIPHVHIHVIPRLKGMRGGVIQGIAKMSMRPTEAEMRLIAELIKRG
ncbi:HIT family protein [Candidatus Bathyarchaeota archaeon]|nr:HIT family protein [Candidatus Bathyarchaeota archaeon]MBS7630028.1 HIT family protein [Candidatus Bathyarchaeota archaeon]